MCLDYEINLFAITKLLKYNGISNYSEHDTNFPVCLK